MAVDVLPVPIATGVSAVPVAVDVPGWCRHLPAPQCTSADTEVPVTWG